MKTIAIKDEKSHRGKLMMRVSDAYAKEYVKQGFHYTSKGSYAHWLNSIEKAEKIAVRREIYLKKIKRQQDAAEAAAALPEIKAMAESKLPKAKVVDVEVKDVVEK